MFSVPVCSHAESVGLCELVQHLIIFDDISASGSLESMLVIQNTPVTVYHEVPFFIIIKKMLLLGVPNMH